MSFKYRLNGDYVESLNSKITGKEILETAGLLPVTDYELLIKINEKGFEPIELSEKIDLKSPGVEGFEAKPYDAVTIYVDEVAIKVNESFFTANQILELTGKIVRNFYLVQLKDDNEISYKNDREHKIAVRNGSKFITYEVEIIDIEHHCNNNLPIPDDCRYKILIDREPYIVNEKCLTGKEILLLANKTPPERFQLRQKFKDGRVVTIPYDQKVCFTDPGIEKFKTIPLDQTEGLVLRNEFTLLEEDEAFLNSLDLKWETVKINNVNWVFVHNYPIPNGYNVSNAILGIRIVGGYPTSPLDMVYFYPSLNRVDGMPITALTPLQLNDKCFQQWSRHRTGANPWRVNVDNLSTHIPLADFWLLNEFEKRPSNAISA